MSSNQIAKLACRIMAVWLFAQAAMGVEEFIAGVIGMLAGPDRVLGLANLYAVALMETVIYGLVGALLWFGAGKIARHASAGSPEAVAGDVLTARTAMEIACSAVGLFLFVNVAGSFSFDVIAALRFHFRGPEAVVVNAVSPNRVVAQFVELALALWLMFGSRGITALILWLRTAGDKSRDREPIESGSASPQDPL
jgi:hypothetical protein